MPRSPIGGLLALAALAAPAAAQTPCVELAPELLRRPGAERGATPVEAGVLLLDLYAVEDARQTFEVDLLLSMRWSDPRLVADGARGADPACSYAIGTVWTPEPLLVNGRSVDASAGVVRVRADGACTLSQRYTGTFSFRSDLRDFPFDRQVLPFEIAIPPRVGDVALTSSMELGGAWQEASVPNWLLLGARGETYERELPQLGETVEGLRYGWEVERHRAYYVWKLIVPLVIVVLMSWSVFWIHPKSALQLGLGATSVLTLIAYRFATAALLPPIGYLTRFDLFLTGASVLVLLALVEALVTVKLGDQERVAAALRVDRASRLLFPLAFVATLAWSFWL